MHKCNKNKSAEEGKKERERRKGEEGWKTGRRKGGKDRKENSEWVTEWAWAHSGQASPGMGTDSSRVANSHSVVLTPCHCQIFLTGALSCHRSLSFLYLSCLASSSLQIKKGTQLSKAQHDHGEEQASAACILDGSCGVMTAWDRSLRGRQRQAHHPRGAWQDDVSFNRRENPMPFHKRSRKSSRKCKTKKLYWPSPRVMFGWTLKVKNKQTSETKQNKKPPQTTQATNQIGRQICKASGASPAALTGQSSWLEFGGSLSLRPHYNCFQQILQKNIREG